MAAPQTLLGLLKSSGTKVDYDTMDVEFVKNLSPVVGRFADCTSNQAIAFFELQKPKHNLLIQESATMALGSRSRYQGVTAPELAVEIAMVKLQVEIFRLTEGIVHIQTNPYYSYDKEKTVANALRLADLFKLLSELSEYDFKEKLCIKIPSSWEGLQACRTLQQEHGIKTLATTLFTIEQAALAAEVGCYYIAPYVNELKVHFEDYIDEKKLFALCAEIQSYYQAYQKSTLVLAASLTSTSDIMALAGINHITIAPVLLQQLAIEPASPLNTRSAFDESSRVSSHPPLPSFADDEPAFRMAFTRRDIGEGERKLSQAINIFCDMQTKLETLMTTA